MGDAIPGSVSFLTDLRIAEVVGSDGVAGPDRGEEDVVGFGSETSGASSSSGPRALRRCFSINLAS